MPLETATYISDLNVANPAHTDGLSQADSQMRLIKATVKATFPNFTSAALASTQAQIDKACLGTAPSNFFAGTAALPGFTPVGDPNTGLWSPAADQLAWSLNGVQVLLMGGSALVTSLGVAAAAFTTTGAYSGGTGQLVPIGGTLIWWDNTLPVEGGYAWANGQIIASANTVCPTLLARWGNRFGGNGTTTMGVPDMRETVPFGAAGMGGTALRGISNSVSSAITTLLGALFGTETVALTGAQIAPHTHGGNTGTESNFHTHNHATAANKISTSPGGSAFFNLWGSTGGDGTGTTTTNSTTHTHPFTTDSGTGLAGTAHNNFQPSTPVNYILRLA